MIDFDFVTEGNAALERVKRRQGTAALPYAIASGLSVTPLSSPGYCRSSRQAADSPRNRESLLALYLTTCCSGLG